jgi:AFG3 family protein
MGGVSSEENRTINQLLSELDGMQGSDNIIVLGATNFPEAIDKALTREGRFDRKVTIPMPDAAARRELFEFYLTRVMTGDPNSKVFTPPPQSTTPAPGDGQKAPTDTPPAPPPPTVIVEGVSNKDLATTLSDRTPGVSPAQIATIVNEAALTAAVGGAKYVALPFLQDAIDDVLIGKKHRQRMSDAALRRTAYHEVGHCITAWMTPLQKDVIKLSIIPRGRAGGYTQQVQDEALDPHTNVFLFSQLCVLAGGRVAEQLIFGDVSTGAMDDLQRATKIAIDKLLMFGMSKGDAGQLSFKHDTSKGEGRGWMPFSEKLHADMESEARDMVDRAFKHTEQLLTLHKDKLVALSEKLLADKELDKAAITSVLGPRITQAPELTAQT